MVRHLRPATNLGGVSSGIDRAPAVRTARWSWLPAVESVVLESGLPFVYDSLDNWLIHPAFVAQRARSELAYSPTSLPAAAAVFASGPASRDVLRRWRDDIEILPNGVDPDMFSGSFPRRRTCPPAPSSVTRASSPNGSTPSWTGGGHPMPDVAFVFLGPSCSPRAVAAMRGIPNVLLLGDRTYDRLPGYLKHFDIGGFRIASGRANGGDPIKLYEYWAAGLPVASTPIDGWEAWGPSVAIVRDAAETSGG